MMGFSLFSMHHIKRVNYLSKQGLECKMEVKSARPLPISNELKEWKWNRRHSRATASSSSAPCIASRSPHASATLSVSSSPCRWRRDGGGIQTRWMWKTAMADEDRWSRRLEEQKKLDWPNSRDQVASLKLLKDSPWSLELFRMEWIWIGMRLGWNRLAVLLQLPSTELWNFKF